MFALGSNYVKQENREKHMSVGEAVTHTCYESYAATPLRGGVERHNTPTRLHTGVHVFTFSLSPTHTPINRHAGGMFALGSNYVKQENREKHMSVGEAVTHTCYESYAATPSGLGPEIFSVTAEGQIGNGGSGQYKLRPEVCACPCVCVYMSM